MYLKYTLRYKSMSSHTLYFVEFKLILNPTIKNKTNSCGVFKFKLNEVGIYIRYWIKLCFMLTKITVCIVVILITV